MSATLPPSTAAPILRRQNLHLPPGFFPLQEAADWAGVSVRTFKRWLSQGLPYHQASPRTKILVRPADIENFLTRHQTAKPSLDLLVDEVARELLVKTMKRKSGL